MDPSESPPPDPLPEIELELDSDLDSPKSASVAPRRSAPVAQDSPASAPATSALSASARREHPTAPEFASHKSIDIDTTLQKLQRAVKTISVTLLVLIALTIVTIYLLFTFQSAQGPESAAPTLVSNNEDSANIQDSLVDITRQLPRMREVTEKFFGAESIDELLPYCRDPDRVAPLLEEYYSRIPFEPVGVLGFALGDSLVLERDSASNRAFAYVSFENTDFHSQTICMEIVDNDFKIDWESAVGYGEMSWDDFLKTRPTEPTLLRLVAMSSDYHNYEFNDPSVWAGFTLFDRDGASSVYGFVPRDSATHQKILQALRGNSSAWLVARLKYPENARSSNCVEIDEIIHDRWVLGLKVERLPSIDLSPVPPAP
jgi:hypothetical protein